MQQYIQAGRMGEEDRAAEAKQNALKMYAPKAFAGDRTAVQGLASAGLVNEAQGFQNQFREDDLRKAQKEIADAEQRARPYMSVETPEQLAQVNAMWAQQGVDPASLPKSVGEARFLTQKVMSIKDQYEAKFREKEFGLKERQANAAIATSGAQRQNYLASARAAEALARQRSSDVAGYGPPNQLPGAVSPTQPQNPQDPIAPISPYSGLNPKDAGRLRIENEKNYAKTRAENEKETNSARQMLADAKTFLQAQARVERQGGGTGGAFSLPLGLGDVAQGAYRAVSPNRDDYATMSAISARIVPTLRQPGSGATSDFDARMFERGTLGLGQPGPTNQVIATGIKAGAENLIAKAQFEDMYFQKYRTLNGADVAWGRYLEDNPIFDPASQDAPRLNAGRKNWQQWLQSMAGQGRPPAGQASLQTDMQQPSPQVGVDAQAAIANARDAIARGAAPQAVAQRLRGAGIDPAQAGIQ